MRADLSLQPPAAYAFLDSRAGQGRLSYPRTACLGVCLGTTGSGKQALGPDPMFSVRGQHSPLACLPRKLTRGDTDPQMPSQVQGPALVLPASRTSTVQELVKASTIEETCHPTAPEPRTQSKNQKKKGCWLPRLPHPFKTTSKLHSLGLWQESHDIYTLRQRQQPRKTQALRQPSPRPHTHVSHLPHALVVHPPQTHSGSLMGHSRLPPLPRVTPEATTSVSKSPAQPDSHKPSSGMTISQEHKGTSALCPESGKVRYVHLPHPGTGGSPNTPTSVPSPDPTGPQLRHPSFYPQSPLLHA